MFIVMGFMALVALACWTWGVLRLVHWILDRRAARVDSAYRAARLVAQARREVGRG